jgi:hypothetical protein
MSGAHRKMFGRQQITNPAQSLKRCLGKTCTEEYSEEPKAPSFRQSQSLMLICSSERWKRDGAATVW